MLAKLVKISCHSAGMCSMQSRAGQNIQQGSAACVYVLTQCFEMIFWQKKLKQEEDASPA